MERFRVVFEVSPPGPFGLPQAGRVVLPGPATTVAWSISPITNRPLGPGTLSRYRPEAEGVAVQVSFDDAMLVFEDNIATVELDADTFDSAAAKATAAMRRVLLQLAVDEDRAFTAAPKIAFVVGSGEGVALNEPISLPSAIAYDLAALTERIGHIGDHLAVEDVRIVRALQYYEHALYLLDNAHRLADVGSPHFEYLFSAMILNFWKAASAIIGEPRERDYQRRYAAFGISPEYFRLEIDGALKDIRNDRDVAHYSSTESQILQLAGPAVTKARSVAHEVIHRYRGYLRSRAVT